MNLKFKNKIVFLTGAGKGIGRQILELLIKENVIVYAVTRNSKDLKDIKTNKNTHLFFGDITNQNLINRIFSKSKKNKHNFNCLINNAGIRQRKKFSKIKEKDLMDVFKNNFSQFLKYLNFFQHNLNLRKTWVQL